MANGHGLGWRIAVPLLRGKGQAGRGHADGRRYRCGRDGEGDGDRDRGRSGCAESNGLTIAAWGQGAGYHIGCDRTGAGAGGWTEGQPRCAIAGRPVQDAVTGIVDSQDLGRRAGLSLLSRKG